MKALIFDMDGLMVDSERLYDQALNEIAIQFNRDCTENVRFKMMGRSPLESMQIFVKELCIPIDAEFALDIRNNMMREKYKYHLEPMPGLFKIINRFYRKLELAISTGAQMEFLNIVIDQLGIRKKFTALQTSDNIKNGKPHPEIYLKTCQLLNLQPKDCIVLEDSVNGALAGKKAGCFVIAVPSQFTIKQSFEFVDYIADDLFVASQYICDFLDAQNK